MVGRCLSGRLQPRVEGRGCCRWPVACLSTCLVVTSPSCRLRNSALHPQDAVRLCDEQGSEFARALINYSSHEVDKVKVSATARLGQPPTVARMCCAGWAGNNRARSISCAFV